MGCLFIPFERLKYSVLGPGRVEHTFFFLKKKVLMLGMSYNSLIMRKLSCQSCRKQGWRSVSLGALIEELGRETSEISLGTVQDLDEEVASCVQG